MERPGYRFGTDARGPLIGIDRSGNTIIAWAGGTGTIHTASLPAGGSWTPVQTLATNYGSGLAMAVNSAGSAVLTWAGKGTGVVGTYADSGTILGRLRRAGQSRPSSLPRRAGPALRSTTRTRR